jgi:hypothetical protein
MPPKAKKKTDVASKKVAAKKKEKVSFCLLGCWVARDNGGQ